VLPALMRAAKAEAGPQHTAQPYCKNSLTTHPPTHPQHPSTNRRNPQGQQHIQPRLKHGCWSKPPARPASNNSTSVVLTYIHSLLLCDCTRLTTQTTVSPSKCIPAHTRTRCGTNTHSVWHTHTYAAVPVVFPRLLALQAALTDSCSACKSQLHVHSQHIFRVFSGPGERRAASAARLATPVEEFTSQASHYRLCALPGPTRHVNIMLHPITSNMYTHHVPQQVILGQAVAEHEAVTETSQPYVL
jgi:hypothetical protein